MDFLPQLTCCHMHLKFSSRLKTTTGTAGIRLPPTTATTQAAESLPEMDRVLGQLPKAVKEFTTAYSHSACVFT